MSADRERDLAEAIHHEIISPDSVDAATGLWQQSSLLDDRSRIWRVLARTSAHALEAVLARRLSEAARTGPWENDGQFLAYLGTDAAKWAAEFCKVARDHGHDLDEGWMIGWFANAIEQARTEPWEPPRVDAQYGRMQDALERISSWSEAYPLDIFPEPDLGLARELLEAGGITLDAVSAYCMRHVIDGVGKIAREATQPGPWEGGHHFQEEDGYPGSLLAGTNPGDTPAGTRGKS